MDVRGIGDIAPESVLLAGAGRAILLQLAHPAVGHGVARHSSFAENPMKRLHGTLMYIYALTNGTEEHREKARSWVDRAHAPVRAEPAPDGAHPAYDARDPELQLWVAATLYDSAMLVHDAVFPPLDEAVADRVYRDYATLGTSLQMPPDHWPATRADFRAYWDSTVATLEVDDAVRSVAHELLAARNAPLVVRAAMPVARLLTTGMLPERLRAEFALPWSPRRELARRSLRRFVVAVYPRLPRSWRHAPMRHYLARLGEGG